MSPQHVLAGKVGNRKKHRRREGIVYLEGIYSCQVVKLPGYLRYYQKFKHCIKGIIPKHQKTVTGWKHQLPVIFLQSLTSFPENI